MTGDRSNRDRAAEARRMADACPRGSLDRRAWGCIGVAFSTTGTLTAASKVLGMIGPADVASRARELFTQIRHMPDPGGGRRDVA